MPQNNYESAVDQWILQQISPLADGNTIMASIIRGANPRQICALYDFFYKHDKSIHQIISTWIDEKITLLRTQILFRDQFGFLNPLSKKITPMLFEMKLYSDCVTNVTGQDDDRYANCLKEVVETSWVKISWVKYKTYLDFLRNRFPNTFSPKLDLIRFYSDRHRLQDNLDYSIWIGEQYPALFFSAVDRLNCCDNVYFQSNVAIFFRVAFALQRFNRRLLSIVIDTRYPDPIEVTNALRPDYLHAVFLEMVNYAAQISGHKNAQFRSFSSLRLTAGFEQLLMNPNFQTQGPQQLFQNNYDQAELQRQSHRVLHMLRQCTLEEHLRLMTQLRIMGDYWVNYGQKMERSLNNHPSMLSITGEILKPFHHRLTFLNHYMSWIHEVRQLTVSKNTLRVFLNYKYMCSKSDASPTTPYLLINAVANSILGFLIGPHLATQEAYQSVNKVDALYERYLEENQPKFKRNFVEWLAPQRHLASENRFSMFQGRPYSRALNQSDEQRSITRSLKERRQPIYSEVWCESEEQLLSQPT